MAVKKVKKVATGCTDCDHRPVCAFKDAFENVKKAGSELEQAHTTEDMPIFGININCRYCKQLKKSLSKPEEIHLN